MTDTLPKGFFFFERKLKNFGIKYWNEEECRKDFSCAKIPSEGDSAAKTWCDERFGDNWIWATPIQRDYTLIYFKDPNDALLFKLSFNTLTTA